MNRDQTDAELLGLNVDDILAESFYTPKHRAMVRNHDKRVENYYLMLKVRDFFDRVDSMQPPPERVKGKPGPKPGYKHQNDRFTDKQMEIAMRSLERND